MKRVVLSISALLLCIISNAQTYIISFTGSGESTTVSSVEVENLTSGATASLTNSGQTLTLTVTTSINLIDNEQFKELKIYPNPMTDNSIVQIFPPTAGNATITVTDITGKKIAQVQNYLDNYLQEFRLSGINRGMYLVSVTGSTYQYSGKLLSNAKANGTASIEKVNSNIQSGYEKTTKQDSKSYPSTINMEYTTGDRLKFTGISGIYSTVITDIPTETKTINFNFIACIDGDGYNYPVVEIGTQTWMAGNLKTTKYNDDTAIPNITVDATWEALATGAYCDYDNTPSNSTTYGRLYNWYAVDNNAATKVASNGGKNVCPTGWHIPSDAEWTTLTDYLTNNGYGYEGSGIDIAKSLANTSGWTVSGTLGAVGNDQTSNNSSGFTGFPSGGRFSYGSYGFVGDIGYWWSSTEYSSSTDAYYRYMHYTFSNVTGGHSRKDYGFSVRCSRD
jgi:uncharacterized protein (TIGR02145 family)